MKKIRTEVEGEKRQKIKEERAKEEPETAGELETRAQI